MVKFIKFSKSVMTQSATNNASGLAPHYVNIAKLADVRHGSTTTASLRVNRNFLASRDVITVTVSAASTPNIISMVDAIAFAGSNGYSNVSNVYTYDTLPDNASTINSIALG